ncbi:MAG: monofunctional biosynthetic peptidoglycan transglycosylase [Chitinophagaceae bacterium]|nr:monofunctional biosynthetic peptidoglycan transglycosylase [Chitinophagaceae bacterium]
MPDGKTTRIKLVVALLIITALIIGYIVRWRKNKLISNIVTKAFRFLIYAHAVTLAYIFLLKWINPPVTLTQLSSWVSGHGLKRDYVGFNSISYNAKLAVISGEDQLFPDHNGFDWNAIKKSLNPSKKKRSKTKKIPPGAGASTISQQVAKNVFLWQGKSYFRKGLEGYFTFMIENIWGKQRILDVYLNCIEMGDGIFGIEAAAQSYFDKPASALSRQEAAQIAACFPSPKRYTVKPLSSFVASKSGWIITQMNNIESDEDIQDIIGTQVLKK